MSVDDFKRVAFILPGSAELGGFTYPAAWGSTEKFLALPSLVIAAFHRRQLFVSPPICFNPRIPTPVPHILWELQLAMLVVLLVD